MGLCKAISKYFKAFQINFKAGALPVGGEGLARGGSSECHLLITSFLSSNIKKLHLYR